MQTWYQTKCKICCLRSLYKNIWPILTVKYCIRFSIYKSIIVHYSDVIMDAIASQITGVTIVYSTACSGADQRKHQSSASVAFVRGIHRWPVNSPHQSPVTRKMFLFHEVIMSRTIPTLTILTRVLPIWQSTPRTLLIRALPISPNGWFLKLQLCTNVLLSKHIVFCPRYWEVKFNEATSDSSWGLSMQM